MAPYAFLAANDAEIKHESDQRDIVLTILTRMGIGVSKINPPLPGMLLMELERTW
ncbi:MAG: hypothetical protein HPY52_08415 [Firmicutes bacterium]|nr:hypothetical protein [Bacillota bacterium]